MDGGFLNHSSQIIIVNIEDIRKDGMAKEEIEPKN